MGHSIIECVLLTGTWSAKGIMASGHCTALTGRTHDRTDQACNVKILLANPDPSTHGPSRLKSMSALMSAIGGKPDVQRR